MGKKYDQEAPSGGVDLGAPWRRLASCLHSLENFKWDQVYLIILLTTSNPDLKAPGSSTNKAPLSK